MSKNVVIPDCDYCIHYDVCLKHDECPHFENERLLVKLPCEVGYPVYLIADYEVLKCEVCEISINIWSGIEIKLMEYDTEKMIPSFFNESEFGKILFLTKKEAEARLKEIRNE